MTRLIEFIESYRKIDDGDYQWNDNHGELIRCKDCIKKPICTIYLETNDDYGYCSMAERKKE